MLVPPSEHHGYEYGDCALLICVLPSNAAAMIKSTMIGMRVIASLPVIVLTASQIISVAEEAKRAPTAAHHRSTGHARCSPMRYFERAARGSAPPGRGRSAALPAAAAQAVGCRLCAAGAAAWLLRKKPATSAGKSFTRCLTT